MIDRETIENRFGIILKNLQSLRKISGMKDKFFSNEHLSAAAKYYLQTSIEAMIDIGNHIIARNKLGVPQSNIKKENLSRYKKMVKFRNLVVHLYHTVDDEKVYEILRNNLQDFETFIKEIKPFLSLTNKSNKNRKTKCSKDEFPF